MNESVYRRLCLTSVCGAILIPVTMALVSGAANDGAGPAEGTAVVASAATTGPAGSPSPRNGMPDLPSPDRITHPRGDAP